MITWSYVGKLANTLLVFAFLTMLVFAILASAPQTLTFAGIAPAGAPAFIAPDQSFIGTAPCSAQRVWVMMRWARGVVAAAAAITWFAGERRYERRAVSAAVVPTSPPARAQGAARRPRARRIEGTQQHTVLSPARWSPFGGSPPKIAPHTRLIEIAAGIRRAPGQTGNVKLKMSPAVARLPWAHA